MGKQKSILDTDEEVRRNCIECRTNRYKEENNQGKVKRNERQSENALTRLIGILK